MIDNDGHLIYSLTQVVQRKVQLCSSELSKKHVTVQLVEAKARVVPIKKVPRYV